MFSIIFVDLSLDVGIGDDRGRLGESREIGSQSRPVGVDEIKTASLAIEVIGVACLQLLFQVDSRVGIILACYRQDRVELAIDLRIPGGKELYLMAPPSEMLAEVVDNPLCPSIALWRDGNINAGDLSDLHRAGNNKRYFTPISLLGKENCRE